MTACFCPRHASERNSELVSLPRNGLEGNSESLLLFLFHGTEFLTFFSSAECFGTEFREFSVPRNSRNSAGTNQLFRLFRLPRNNFFCRKLPTLIHCRILFGPFRRNNVKLSEKQQYPKLFEYFSSNFSYNIININK